MAKRRVLIVEDDVLTAMDLEAFVKQEVDADVLLSRSVALAKKLIDPPVDLAFLDVDVTNGKTFEVAVLLKVRQIPFVFLSGSRREHIPEELRDVPFIAKPYNKQQLTEHLRKIIPESPE